MSGLRWGKEVERKGESMSKLKMRGIVRGKEQKLIKKMEKKEIENCKRKTEG